MDPYYLPSFSFLKSNLFFHDENSRSLRSDLSQLLA
jgi:hypothetical protein